MEIFVGNLPFDITEQDIKDAFAPFVDVAALKMLTDKFSGRFRGIAFVTVEDEEKGRAAIEALNGKELGGRPMRVDAGRERPRFGGFNGGGFKPRQGGFRSNNGGGRPPFRRSFDGQGDGAPRDGGFRPRGEGGFRPRSGGFKRREDGGNNRRDFHENSDESFGG